MAFLLSDKELDGRLNAARAAQDRSRFAFITSTVVSLALLGLVYNSYLSIYRVFAFNHYYKHIDPKTDFDGGGPGSLIEPRHVTVEATYTKVLQEKLMQEWVASRFITFSPLGIRFGVGDAPIFGAFALLVTSSWYFYVSRRENFTIAVLLRDAWNTGNNGRRWRVFHEINSYTIFTTVVHNNMPFKDLTQPDPRDHSDGQNKSFRRMKLVSNSFLHFLPALSLLFAIAFELQAEIPVLRSPFRDPPSKSLNPQWEHWIVYPVSLIALGYIWFMNNQIHKFSAGTERVLRQFRRNLLQGTDRLNHVRWEKLPHPRDHKPPALAHHHSNRTWWSWRPASGPTRAQPIYSVADLGPVASHVVPYVGRTLNGSGAAFAVGTDAQGKLRAWRREADETKVLLAKIPGDSESVPVALNDANVVVGYSTRPVEGSAGTFFRAVRWSAGGKATPLAPANWQSHAYDVNDAGVVVGDALDTHCHGGAVRFNSDGSITDLNTVLDDSGAGWHLTEARQIDLNGQIVGTGYQDLDPSIIRGFRLTPQGGSPPAATLVSLAIAPASLVGGTTATGTVTLSNDSPAGGASVALAVDKPHIVGVPSRIEVAEGKSSATFELTTQAVTATTHAGVTATYSGITKAAPMQLNPAPPAEAVAIDRADYCASGEKSSGKLIVEATSTRPAATLRVLISSTRVSIGTLNKRDNASYTREFSGLTNPEAITVRSDLGGSADHAVTVR